MFCSFIIFSPGELKTTLLFSLLCNNQKQCCDVGIFLSLSRLLHHSRDILDSVHLHPGSRDQLDVTNYQERTHTVTVTLQLNCLIHNIAQHTPSSVLMNHFHLIPPQGSSTGLQSGPSHDLSAPKRITPGRDDNKVYGVSICEQLCVVITRPRMQPHRSVQLSPARK